MIEEPERSVCYLDTNAFIGAFEGTLDQTSPLEGLFEHFRSRPKAAITSELTLAELLSPSGARSSRKMQDRLYRDLLLRSNFIDLRPVTRDVLLKTVELRRYVPHKLQLPDAIHIATAIQARCPFVMSADKDYRSLPSGMTWVRPDPDGIATVLKALDA
jgi:predicted nucleic acid-binding protein